MSRLIELLPSPEIDENLLASERLENLRGTMLVDGLDVLVLTNPVSIRYATGYRVQSSMQSRIPTVYAIVPIVGPIIVHGTHSGNLPLVDVFRRSHAITSFDAGLELSVAADRFAADIELALDELGYDSRASVGVERTTPTGHRAFADIGLNVFDAEPTVELARSRKSDLELVALDFAVAVAEYGMTVMQSVLEPGITENQLFAILHQVNIAHGGDSIDGRMLCSGPRTNPWYQEASHRRIESGDLVAFDTDMVGPYGYCADIGRTWVCDAEPTPEQQDLYRRALHEIEHNMALLHVGASFEELSHSVLRHPDEFVANRSASVFHGVGMTDEYPKIPHHQDWEWAGYDGQLEDGVVLAVESFVGSDRGSQGVRLEQLVRVTSGGIEVMSSYPLWDLQP
ncbi:MAG: M24 family metallopeptidase [Acidimicrobiales bacterium]